MGVSLNPDGVLTMSYEYNAHQKAFHELTDGEVYGASKYLVSVYVKDHDLPGREPHCYWVGRINDFDDARYFLTIHRMNAFQFEKDMTNYSAIEDVVNTLKENYTEVDVLGATVIEIVGLNVDFVEIR